MKPFRDLSMRSKLMLIITLTSSSAVLVASLLFVVNDTLKFRMSVREELQALAEIVSKNSRAALTFNDRNAARETISAVRTNPRILCAFIFTKNNTVFASYISENADLSVLRMKMRPNAGGLAPVEEGTMRSLIEEAGSFWNWDYVVHDILLDDQAIGMVMIQTDPGELAQRVKWFISVISMVMTFVLLAVYLLSSRVQKLISGPIEGLSRVMRLVSDKKNYSIRADKQGSDEVGVLIDGFNDMLEQIQKRDKELKTYQEFLEAEVAKRTAALSEWRTTFDSTKDAIILLDEHDVVIRANRSVTTYLDHPFSDVMGFTVYHLFETKGFPSTIGPLSRGRQTLTHEQEEIHVPGRGMWFILSVDPIMKPSGSYAGAVLILRDVTDWKKAAESQKDLQSQLIQAQKMESIGTLAGGIAHDFNNILSAIIGFSHVAQMRLPKDHPAAESVRIIYEAGERAAALTRQLLAFSRKQVLDMKPIDLNAVIENLAKMLRRVIGENITLDLKLRTPLKNIMADISQMEQIIMNLVVNARDAVSTKGVIVVSTEVLPAGEAVGQKIAAAPCVMLTVADTGMGMNKETQDRIFEPFFTTKGMGKGTGLGLSTVYGIVQQHNGQIIVDSEEGRGTAFKLLFPIVEHVMARAADRQQPTMTRGTETVLVVDDEPNIRKLLVQTLEPLGYIILAASTGEEALTVSDAHPGAIHLLVTDIVMPGMNGVQLAETFLQRRPGTKVLFISGYTDTADVTGNLKAAGSGFLQKPLIPGALVNKIRQVLDLKKETTKAARAPGNLSRMRILYADDDESSRLLIRNFLEPSGCVLDLCENGKLAFEKFQTGGYDLVFMDIQMPVMDGLESVRAMRAWEHDLGRSKTPIIALSGMMGEAEVRACLDAGFTSHLMKPIKRQVFLGAVGAHAPEQNSSSSAEDGTSNESSGQ